MNRRITPTGGKRHVGGYIAAGVVAAVGTAVARVVVGQRVVAFGWSGSHAELFATPEDFVFPYPAELDDGIAATIPIAFGTASDALFHVGKLCSGETVLIRVRPEASGSRRCSLPRAREPG